jgi:hypothetical protein
MAKKRSETAALVSVGRATRYAVPDLESISPLGELTRQLRIIELLEEIAAKMSENEKKGCQ